MFEPDLQAGTEVQLMRRSFSDFEYVRKRSEEILKLTENKNPFFCFYIDCGGRASAYSGTEGEEAEEQHWRSGHHLQVNQGRHTDFALPVSAGERGLR